MCKLIVGKVDGETELFIGFVYFLLEWLRYKSRDAFIFEVDYYFFLLFLLLFLPFLHFLLPFFDLNFSLFFDFFFSLLFCLLFNFLWNFLFGFFLDFLFFFDFFLRLFLGFRTLFCCWNLWCSFSFSKNICFFIIIILTFFHLNIRARNRIVQIKFIQNFILLFFRWKL